MGLEEQNWKTTLNKLINIIKKTQDYRKALNEIPVVIACDADWKFLLMTSRVVMCVAAIY